MLIGIAALASGCATSPVKVSQSQRVSGNRLLSGYSALAQPSPAKARVIVIRDAGMLAVAAPARLSVDGAPVARFWAGERVEFYLPGGDHIFAVQSDAQLQIVRSALIENSFSFKPGRTYYFRISITESSFFIQPSTQLQ